MSRTEKNLSQIISEVQISMLDENESAIDDQIEENNSAFKDSVLAKCKNTIENLYEEIESQKRQRREAELLCRENENRIQNLEKRLKESNSKTLEYKEEIEKLLEINSTLKKTAKALEKNSQNIKNLENLEEEILGLKVQVSEKSQIIQDLNVYIKNYEVKLQKIEAEYEKVKEENEEVTQKNEDLTFKCERLTSQAKISETITFNLKQAQEDYQRYLKDEKENFETKEKDLKEKYEQLEIRLKKKFQNKEFQLKQEVNQSIEEIQKSLEINDSECSKIRSENITLKDHIKGLNESSSLAEKNFKEQIEKLEYEIKNLKIALKEKIATIEKLESFQRIEKNKYENSVSKEKELENIIKSYDDKIKALEAKTSEHKKNAESLSSEVLNLKSDLQKEMQKNEAKQSEIEILSQREKEYQAKITKLKEESQQLVENLSKDCEERIETNSNLLRMQLTKDFEISLDEYKSKVQSLVHENKSLKKKIDQRSNDLQKLKMQKNEYKETAKIIETHSDEAQNDEILGLKQKLSKIQKQKTSIEQNYLSLKEEFVDLEEKIKQDSAFFRNETQRKDEEFTRLKKKYETKLREIYAENSLITEQLRSDLLRLNTDIRNRDTKETNYWISKTLEEMLKRIPSY